MSGPPVGWGVIGATSQVARKAVLPAIVASPGARLVAVASRSAADGGAGRFEPLRAHRAYDAVLDDPEVEAVYVPLPNSLHREWVVRAAAAGKHVLCEKPLAPSAADAEAMAAACERARVALVEAYMTPFHPRAMALEALVASGRLGALRFARAASSPASSIAATTIAGVPRWAAARCSTSASTASRRSWRRRVGRRRGWRPRRRLAKSGVDVSFSGWLDFGDGFTATIECSFDAPERQLLEIVGTEAALVVDRAYTPGPADTTMTLRHRDGRCEEIVAGGADPYREMIEHFQEVVRGGAVPRRSGPASITLLAVLERLRAAAGLAA